MRLKDCLKNETRSSYSGSYACEDTHNAPISIWAKKIKVKK